MLYSEPSWWPRPLLSTWSGDVTLSSESGLETTQAQHKAEVVKIQDQVKVWMKHKKKKGQKMATDRPSWKSFSLSKGQQIQIFQSFREFEPNPEIRRGQTGFLYSMQTVTLEPGVMMGQISRYLIKRGWTLPMVPELENLSVGGLICGAGCETSSHLLGCFHDTCLSYEVVLPNSQVVTCSKENDPDLFYAIPGSFGTVAFLTAITIPIIPAKRYVKQDYRLVSSIDEFHSLMKSEPSHDFVEGLAFSKNRIILMFGDMTDSSATPSCRVNPVNRWHKLPFYTQIENIAKNLRPGSSFKELIPLSHYYHRHSRAFFWELSEQLPAVNSPLFLFLFGWSLPVNFEAAQAVLPNFIYKFLAKGQVLQDYYLPAGKAQAFFDKAHEMLEIYPVWICPIRIQDTPSMFRGAGPGMYIDYGYYGYSKAQGFHPVKTLQTLEKLLVKSKGFQGMYADCYLSKKQFHEMWDTALYNRVRKERGIESAFPDVYDKAGPKARGHGANFCRDGPSK